MNKITRLPVPLRLWAALAAALFAGGVLAQGVFEPVDYSDPDSWLCRGEDESLGACETDLTTTVIMADGEMATETWSPHPNPPIDCFYVYPTVSLDSTPNSDLQAGPEEYSVIAQQFARFGSKCRTFAPMYRQLTLRAIRGDGAAADREMGYRDISDAWNYYLENYNNGRGVVLIGHSQGSFVLTRLIAQEIEGKPIDGRIVSAMLLGTTVQVPENGVVGGTFKEMPICTAGDQTGCIIVYASFRETLPPSPDSIFAANDENTVAACVNPAQLAKGTNYLHAYLDAAPEGRTATREWTVDYPRLDTPFASVPGLLLARCVMTDSHHYLEIAIDADPEDPRTDDIGGDIMDASGEADASWGLHLIDANVAMGDLLTILDRQTEAYLQQ